MLVHCGFLGEAGRRRCGAGRPARHDDRFRARRLASQAAAWADRAVHGSARPPRGPTDRPDSQSSSSHLFAPYPLKWIENLLCNTGLDDDISHEHGRGRTREQPRERRKGDFSEFFKRGNAKAALQADNAGMRRKEPETRCFLQNLVRRDGSRTVGRRAEAFFVRFLCPWRRGTEQHEPAAQP